MRIIILKEISAECDYDTLTTEGLFNMLQLHALVRERAGLLMQITTRSAFYSLSKLPFTPPSSVLAIGKVP